jgi:hypothetical protein
MVVLLRRWRADVPTFGDESIFGHALTINRFDGWPRTAPVSHQKRPDRNAANVMEIKRKPSKINEADRYSAAHNGLVAGSSPAGPTNNHRAA